jgi:hypothetical protein
VRLLPDGKDVWFWHPDADAKLAKTSTRLAGDGGKRAREEHAISRKTIVQGMPECSGIAQTPLARF